MGRRRMSVIESADGRRLQADGAQHVPPRFGAVILRVGFTCERTETHRIDPVRIERSNRRARRTRLLAVPMAIKPRQFGALGQKPLSNNALERFRAKWPRFA